MTTSSEVDSAVAQLQGKSPQEVLAWALDKFHPHVSLASSFGAEDVVLIDMMARIRPDACVFTLDTGRLPGETYDAIAAIAKKYPQLQLQTMFPQTEAVEKMVREHGINLFYDTVENRKLCCYIRKVEPLNRALEGLQAWITGLRRDQTDNRSQMEVVELDAARDILKINPLIDWTNDMVWEYIRANDVPYNALHDRHYPSIGCAPCTRAIAPGEDLRAGRWWWEQNNQECGLHVNAEGKLVRAKG
ncbi:phosphoadenylyl-sulfate reductase [Pseudanabaena sp. PCC 6802]|uniref:phosphoadenylyl-sulfate reductase n=1 Tax=Pseudanabaena sp. PCC 6802 TaxID=118173 RepID=UPI0003497F76|nr:phosphoadenylyl-sulfate reductase [Pseudanabaena sp. PCC 6802]